MVWIVTLTTVLCVAWTAAGNVACMHNDFNIFETESTCLQKCRPHTECHCLQYEYRQHNGTYSYNYRCASDLGREVQAWLTVIVICTGLLMVVPCTLAECRGWSADHWTTVHSASASECEPVIGRSASSSGYDTFTHNVLTQTSID